MNRTLSYAIMMGLGVLAGCAAPQRDVATMSDLPKDIHPETRSRLSQLQREQLDDAGKRVYDSVLDPKRPTIAGFQGPAGIWLHSPKVGEPIREFNRIMRNEVALEPRLRELAILVTARELDNQFEWSAHEPVALKEGLDPGILDHHRQTHALGSGFEEVALLGGGFMERYSQVRPHRRQHQPWKAGAGPQIG